MASVMLIPGFGGNVLRHRFPLSPDGWRTAWLEPTVLLGTGLGILALDPTGAGPAYPFLPTLEASTAIYLYYPALIQRLTQAGHRVDIARTDWRRPLSHSAAYVATAISQYAEDAGEPISVIAHSRGGLLAQAVVQQLALRGQVSAVRQVIGLCVPWRGSYAPVPYLGGWPWVTPWALLCWTAPGVLMWSDKARHVLRSVCITFPGLYELLPDPAAAAANGDATAESLYDPASWAGSGVPVNATHLAAAHLRWLNDPGWPGGVRLNSIVGTGLGTVCSQVIPTHLGQFGCLVGGVDGDGVVPAWSQTPVGVPGIALPVNHQGVLSDPAAGDVILGLLRS